MSLPDRPFGDDWDQQERSGTVSFRFQPSSSLPPSMFTQVRSEEPQTSIHRRGFRPHLPVDADLLRCRRVGDVEHGKLGEEAVCFDDGGGSHSLVLRELVGPVLGVDRVDVWDVGYEETEGHREEEKGRGDVQDLREGGERKRSASERREGESSSQRLTLEFSRIARYPTANLSTTIATTAMRTWEEVMSIIAA